MNREVKKIDFSKDVVNTKHYHFCTIGRNMFTFKEYGSHVNNNKKTCFVCKYKFKAGDSLAILISDKSYPNQICCNECSEKIIKEHKT